MARKLRSDVWRLHSILLVLALGFLARVSAESIVFHLRNGDRLTGKVVTETTNSVTIATPFFGSVQVPLREISKREPIPDMVASTNKPVAVAATNQPAASVPPALKAKEPKPPLSPANPEATPIASTPKFWKHDIRFGLNLRYSEKDSQEFLGIVKSTYGKQPFRQLFDLNFKYGRTEGALVANSLAASEKTEYQLSPKTYVFGLAAGGYDEIRKIDRQYELGPGFGVELLKQTNFVWKSELGFNFQQQFRSDDTRQTSYSARIAEIFAWRIWDKLTSDMKIEFFPNLADVGEYRLRIESTLRYPISDRLSLNLDVIDLYDTQSARDVDPNDLQIRSTIGVSF